MGAIQIKRMKNIVTLFLLVLNLFGCIKKAPDKVDSRQNSEEVAAEMELWLDSLVSARIEEKGKSELFDDLRGDYIQGMFTGFGGELSDSYISYMALREILPENELVDSLASNDPGIRYHSFLLTIEREKNDVFEILKTILTDTSMVISHFGCVLDSIRVADLCIDLVTEKYNSNSKEYEPTNYQLTESEKIKLDSIVLSNDLQLRYKDQLESKKLETSRE